MRIDPKSLLPLVVGGLLLAVAVTGFLLTRGSNAPTGKPGARVAHSDAEPARPKADATPAAVVEAPAQLTPEEIAVQDEQDIVRILLDQIDKTPAEIDQEWLSTVFRYIHTREDMEKYMAGVLADGGRFQQVWNAEMAKKKQVPSRNPNAYVFEARDYIYAKYAGGLDKEKLASRARNLLALALYVEHENAAEEQREVRDEVLTTFFRESSALYDALQQTTIGDGGDPRPWMDEHTRLLEAAIVNRYYLIQELRAKARERYAGSNLSAQPARVRIEGWQKALTTHLMALGRLYIDAATRETTYKLKQQEAAESGFRALAMVYRKTQSPEALRVLREANRIQRYNLWQMARASWRQASAAAEAGRRKEAEDKYFEAKMRYLECLARLEESKKPKVAGELAALQEQIATWVRGQAAGEGE